MVGVAADSSVVSTEEGIGVNVISAEMHVLVDVEFISGDLQRLSSTPPDNPILRNGEQS